MGAEQTPVEARPTSTLALPLSTLARSTALPPHHPTGMRTRTLVLALASAIVPFTLHAQGAKRPTVAEATRFIENAEAQLAELSVRANQAGWVAATYITDDTEALNAEASKNYAVAVQKLALSARRFDKVKLPASTRRKFKLLRLGLSAPPPGNPGEAAELTKLTTSMEADYGKGSYCPATGAPTAT